MHFSHSIFPGVSLVPLPGRETGDHKQQHRSRPPQHRRKACSSWGAWVPSLEGENNPLSLQTGKTKPSALVTKRQILPPFITYQPKQERSSTGYSCTGLLSSLGFTNSFRCHFQLSPGWGDYDTPNARLTVETIPMGCTEIWNESTRYGNTVRLYCLILYSLLTFNSKNFSTSSDVLSTCALCQKGRVCWSKKLSKQLLSSSPRNNFNCHCHTIFLKERTLNSDQKEKNLNALIQSGS